MDSSGELKPPVHRTWWLRNWVGIVVGLTGLVCFVGLVLLLVLGLFRGSDAYANAIAQARSSAAVVRELGAPIQPGWWVIGSININGPSGTADFETPLRGPVGRGTLYVTAEKQAGRWQYKVLEVAVEGRKDRIDLLEVRDGV